MFWVVSTCLRSFGGFGGVSVGFGWFWVDLVCLGSLGGLEKVSGGFGSLKVV